MDLLTNAVGGALVEVGLCLCRCVKNAIKFRSDRDSLISGVKNLRYCRDVVIDQLEQVEDDGHRCSDEVTKWLTAVEKLDKEVNSILASLEAANTGNRFKLCPNCFLGCTLGMEVANMLGEVKQLIKDGIFPSGLVVEIYKRVEHILGPSIENQPTASKKLSQVLGLLNNNDDVRRIGVWGMAGVGKTTLMKNLNNMLDNSSTTHDQFSIVIWATVSQNFDLKKVQEQIANRLKLSISMEESVERTASLLYERLVEIKSFLLILDDVWERIDLDSLGIPEPKPHNSYKVIITARSFNVCRVMRTDKAVQVDILSDEESWNLFCRHAGDEVATLTDIEPLAKKITRECHGLPLAIITVGASMREKKMPELWKDALKALQRSTPYIPGIEDMVFRPLKWSYDSLQGMGNIKSCFLYCCLYPEDFEIQVKELLHSWFAEGVLDELDNYEDSYNRGIALVEYLKDSCLLEHGAYEDTVKMHDVVRDVGKWIASSLEAEHRSLVQSGMGLTHLQLDKLSESVNRVSFMCNRIMSIPDCPRQYPHVSTLLLQRNPFENVPEGFLLGFPTLKFLDLSYTRIQTLPLSLLKCGELQALFLRDCVRIKEISSLRGLTKLKMIDFSGTQIKELPEGMEKLTNLRQLFLMDTASLNTIRAGVIPQLYRLEVLDMTDSAYKWATRVGEGEASFEELRCLTQLSVLNIHLDLSCLSLEPPCWLLTLKKFQFLIGREGTFHTVRTKFDESRATFCEHNFSKTGSLGLLNCATSLCFTSCEEMEQNLKNLCFTNLKALCITYTHLFKEENKGKYLTSHKDLLPNLEELHLEYVQGINSISQLAGHFGLKLSKLRVIQVFGCQDMNHILSVGGLVMDLESLEEVAINYCIRLVEIFRCESSSQTSVLVDTSALNLKIVKLKELPRLETLSQTHVSWQRLEVLEVFKCDLLQKLPFTAQIPNTIKEIRGESEWWDQLEWDDKDKNQIGSNISLLKTDKRVHLKPRLCS